MAAETGLDPDIELGHAIVANFLDPILNQTISGDARWIPQRAIWQQNMSDS
jgi:hypothetical protein